VLPVRGRDARLALRGPRASAQAPVQATPFLACERRFLTRGASTGSGAAALAEPIRAKAPRNALFKVAICHAENSTSYGVLIYPIIGGGARVGWPGPCTLVRAKLNNANWFYA